MIDTKNPKVRIKILMTGTKIAACHQIMADCDDLAVCSELALHFEKYEYFVRYWCVCLNHFELLNEK